MTATASPGHPLREPCAGQDSGSVVDGAARLARHPNLIEPRTPIAPSGEQIELACGDQRVVVVEVGAGLRSYFADDRAGVDGYAADEIATSGRGPPLIPWPNPIAVGS